MTREEKWLNGIAAGMNGESPLPEVPSKPVWHSEQMLAAIYDAVTEADDPRPFPPRAWRLDEFLSRARKDTQDNAFAIETSLCAVEKFNKGTRWDGYYTERMLEDAKGTKWSSLIYKLA